VIAALLISIGFFGLGKELAFSFLLEKLLTSCLLVLVTFKFFRRKNILSLIKDNVDKTRS